MLLETNYDLKNRYMHIDYVEEITGQKSQSAVQEAPKGKNCTLECTLEELLILQIIQENPSITQKLLAEKLGKSEGRGVSNEVHKN